MWYFIWILGINVALAFGIINGMWFESYYDAEKLRESKKAEEMSPHTN
ncbi:cytochrome bd-I oxidase subunit CydX [Candidatus Vallotiella sp. (ex Adelges kitamiensis)]|nr:cytochrome bd-I oxidase subunit CydX [Candidatus Vallotia sp. (ex Adelges kitamiensis)]